MVVVGAMAMAMAVPVVVAAAMAAAMAVAEAMAVAMAVAMALAVAMAVAMAVAIATATGIRPHAFGHMHCRSYSHTLLRRVEESLYDLCREENLSLSLSLSSL